MPDCPRFIAARSMRCLHRGNHLSPETFFAGAGIDRADALRGKPEAVAALLPLPTATALVWNGGAPALNEAGRLTVNAVFLSVFCVLATGEV